MKIDKNYKNLKRLDNGDYYLSGEIRTEEELLKEFNFMRENIGLFKAKRLDNGEEVIYINDEEIKGDWVFGNFYKSPHSMTMFTQNFICSEPKINKLDESNNQEVMN